MSRRIYGLSRVLVVVAAVLLAAVRADANLIPMFTGNTFPDQASDGVDGHVNFMVLDRTGGVDGDTWHTGLANFDTYFFPGTKSASLDTQGQYLYLFQSVNDHTNTLEIAMNGASAAPGLVTSYGYFDGVGFTQNGSPTVGSVASDLAGGVYLGGQSGAAGNTAPAYVNGVGAGLALDNGVQAPDSVRRNPSSVLADFADSWLLSGAKSVVWGYTSNQPPTWGTTSMLDGGTSAMGTVPTPTPEPSILALLGTGAVGLLAYAWRRRKRS